MSKYRKYTRTGSINQFYMEERIEQLESQNYHEISIEEMDRALECKFSFLLRHSGSDTELELAKSILGIN